MEKLAKMRRANGVRWTYIVHQSDAGIWVSGIVAAEIYDSNDFIFVPVAYIFLAFVRLLDNLLFLKYYSMVGGWVGTTGAHQRTVTAYSMHINSMMCIDWRSDHYCSGARRAFIDARRVHRVSESSDG